MQPMTTELTVDHIEWLIQKARETPTPVEPVLYLTPAQLESLIKLVEARRLDTQSIRDVGNAGADKARRRCEEHAGVLKAGRYASSRNKHPHLKENPPNLSTGTPTRKNR